jgi:hypothetical protein
MKKGNPVKILNKRVLTVAMYISRVLAVAARIYCAISVGPN